MAFMSLNGIDVSYDKKKQILKGLNLEVEEGELVSLLGPSGCGKSTTLRVVAGFIDPQGGTFTLDGEDMTKVPVHKRQFGLVFQSYALFPHLSVYDNVAFGLRTRKMDKDLIDKKVREILEVCGLTELADRFPKQMSGGQRQRIGIARALAVQPEFIVLDEPISTLDVSIQAQIVNLLVDLQKKMGLTYLFVAHDLSMVKHISDRVAVLYLGTLVELTTSEELYANPRHPYTQALLSAIPIPDPKVEAERDRKKIRLEGEVPSPINTKPGCKFQGRCKYAKDICRQQMPELKDVGNNHFVACHFCDALEENKEL